MGEGDVLTRNDQCLGCHDEDYLHWPKLLESQLTTVPDGETQLGAKHQAEETETGAEENSRKICQPGQLRGLVAHGLLVVHDSLPDADQNDSESKEHR